MVTKGYEKNINTKSSQDDEGNKYISERGKKNLHNFKNIQIKPYHFLTIHYNIRISFVFKNCAEHRRSGAAPFQKLSFMK